MLKLTSTLPRKPTRSVQGPALTEAVRSKPAWRTAEKPPLVSVKSTLAPRLDQPRPACNVKRKVPLELTAPLKAICTPSGLIPRLAFTVTPLLFSVSEPLPPMPAKLMLVLTVKEKAPLVETEPLTLMVATTTLTVADTVRPLLVRVNEPEPPKPAKPTDALPVTRKLPFVATVPEKLTVATWTLMVVLKLTPLLLMVNDALVVPKPARLTLAVPVNEKVPLVATEPEKLTVATKTLMLALNRTPLLFKVNDAVATG